MAFIKLTLLTFGLLYGAALSGLYVFQRELQYFPSLSDPAPAEVGLEEVDRVELATPDGETLVLWVAQPAGNRPVILFLPGNAGAIADRAQRFAFYQSRGYGALFLSYRGYGGSSGTPSEEGLLTDAGAAYDYLRSAGFPPDRIALVAESLGTGLAVQLAARRPVGAVVLEAPFSAAVDIARAAYPWVPVGLLMKDQFRSRDHIGKVRAPLLVLHGEADSIIPIGFGKRLFEAAASPKTFLSLGPVGHEAIADPATWAAGIDFLDRVFAP